MVDPLGIISAQQASGLTPTARSQPGQSEGPSFKDVLMENIKKVNQLQQDATTAIEDLQAGRRHDLETVLMATAKADTAFRMLLNVRNKMMDAYNEIREIRV